MCENDLFSVAHASSHVFCPVWENAIKLIFVGNLIAPAIKLLFHSTVRDNLKGLSSVEASIRTANKDFYFAQSEMNSIGL